MLPMLLYCMLGLPLPAIPSKTSDERFPCELCPCGCNTAAHCWDKCCCYSDQEKLDWAEKNHVLPPEFLVRRVAKSKTPASKIALASKATSPASLATKSTCRCCKSCSSKAESKKVEARKVHRSSKTVLLIAALKCQGIQLAFSIFSSTIIPSQCGPVTQNSPPFLEMLESRDVFALDLYLDLDGPVPRSA